MSSKRSSRPLPVLLTKRTATSTHGVEAALAQAEAREAREAREGWEPLRAAPWTQT